ncbi:MAG: carbon storage regulator CsrA [Phycisphaerae bacterium]|nr:carbon storage regulator CsrA [Phycisphaerae bacterium]
MLVLSRQRDQTIIIGDNIEITVVDIRGEKVRLGISAPAHIPVHRKEVYDSIKQSDETGENGSVRSLAKKHHDSTDQTGDKQG